MFTATGAAVLLAGFSMFTLATATNPTLPPPGECTTYALYGEIQTKCNTPNTADYLANR